MSQRDEQLEELREELQDLAEKRFGVDSEGDPRVEVILVDRTRTQSLRYIPLPYEHKAASQEERDQILDIAHRNLGIAMRDFDTEYRIAQSRKREK